MVVKLEIPETAKILVTNGQKVTFGEPFYEISSDEEATFAFAQKLGVKPQDIFKYAKVVVGDTVEEGTILGEKKKVLGKRKTKSDTAGVIKSIDHVTGAMIISVRSSQSATVSTFFTGEIVELSEKEDFVSIEIGKADTFAAEGATDMGGPTHYVSEKDFFAYGEEEVKDRIIFVDTVQSHIESKIEALGGVGIVYAEGNPSGTLQSARIKNAKDWKSIKEKPDSTALFSHSDQKLYIYA